MYHLFGTAVSEFSQKGARFSYPTIKPECLELLIWKPVLAEMGFLSVGPFLTKRQCTGFTGNMLGWRIVCTIILVILVATSYYSCEKVSSNISFNIADLLMHNTESIPSHSGPVWTTSITPKMISRDLTWAAKKKAVEWTNVLNTGKKNESMRPIINI